MMTKQVILVLLLISILLCVYYYSSPCNVLERIPYMEGTTIEVVEDSCSEGLPHTRNHDTIVMPLSAWNSSRKEDTLRHEMVHIRQRRDKDLWYAFYRDEWDYVPISFPPELNAGMIRPNPDTADSPCMLWRNRWLFLPCYSGDRTLRNAEIRVYDVQSKTFVEVPPEWGAFFSADIFQNEHPHEISAELLTSRRESVASLKLNDFFQKHYS